MAAWEIIALSAFITMLLGVGLLSLGAEKGGLWVVVAGVILGMAAVIVQECCEVAPPTAIDVYRGKTTLEITYRDSVAIDSTVVYKVKR